MLGLLAMQHGLALVYQRCGCLKLHALVQIEVQLGQLELSWDFRASASAELHLLRRYLLL